MAKRNRGLTRETIRKLRKEGRGQGEGADYLPWLTVQDVPSLGQVNRPLGWKTGRVHQLLSQNELHYFYLLEWSPAVVDIREQYPLWPLEETQEIAIELGLRHPAPYGNRPMVMTSDFRITLHGDKEAVRTVKGANELDKERALQKLDIEREYWQRRGVDWGIVVAEDLPLTVVKNVKWLHPHLVLHDTILDGGNLNEVTLYLTEEVFRSPEDSLANVTSRCDDALNLPHGSCLALARHLLASRHWQVDMTTPINPSIPMALREPQGV